MTIIKSILAGFVGSVAGALAASFVHPALDSRAPWALLLAGLFAGLAIRFINGADRNFAAGLIGSVTTLIGIAGTSVVLSMMAMSSETGDFASPIARAFNHNEVQGDVSETDPVEPVTTEKGPEELPGGQEQTDEPTPTDNQAPTDKDIENTEPATPPPPTSVEDTSLPGAEAPDVFAGKRQTPPKSPIPAIVYGISALIAFATGGALTLPRGERQPTPSE